MVSRFRVGFINKTEKKQQKRKNDVSLSWPTFAPVDLPQQRFSTKKGGIFLLSKNQLFRCVMYTWQRYVYKIAKLALCIQKKGAWWCIHNACWGIEGTIIWQIRSHS